MEQLTLTDWLFFFCCSEKNRKSILKNIKKNNNYIEGVKSNPKSDSIYVLCNKDSSSSSSSKVLYWGRRNCKPL